MKILSIATLAFLTPLLMSCAEGVTIAFEADAPNNLQTDNNAIVANESNTSPIDTVNPGTDNATTTDLPVIDSTTIVSATDQIVTPVIVDNSNSNETADNANAGNPTPGSNVAEVTESTLPSTDNTNVAENSAASITFLGDVGTRHRVGDNQGSGFASFRQYDDGVPDWLLTANRISEDSCVYTEQRVLEETPSDSITVSAGEVLPMISNAGTFMQLNRNAFDELIFYSADPASVDGALPGSLSIDIPGDVYPAFANVALPVVQSLSVIAPVTDAAITPETTFIWSAGFQPDAYITITANIFDGTVGRSVSCTVVDDGNFNFPQEIRDEMGEDFLSLDFIIARYLQTREVRGNALLLKTAISVR